MAMYPAWYYRWIYRDENYAEQTANPFVINIIISISFCCRGRLWRHSAERRCFGTLSTTAVHTARIRPEYRLVIPASRFGKYKSDWALHGTQLRRSSICLRAARG